jgi:malonyl-CoA decarboxylase
MRTTFFKQLLASMAHKGRHFIEWEPSAVMNSNDDQDIGSLAEALLSERGAASGVALARDTLGSYRNLSSEQKLEFFNMMHLRFGPDHNNIKKAAQAFLDSSTDADAIHLHEAAEPRRQELIRRLNRAPHGTEELVRMREDLLAFLRSQPQLAEVDHDFDHLLASWFNPGFLVLERIDWDSPASILEKIIRYEAVHEIQSWDDLRQRIDSPDRRCYAYFHPALADEPLIFVEVALTQSIPDAIGPILDKTRQPIKAEAATTAVFYSISNCQKGLRGVSFGNFLIKGVVEELKRDLPHLETFVTLSPAPTFRRWLHKLLMNDPHNLLDARTREIVKQVEDPDWVNLNAPEDDVRQTLLSLAAHYYLLAKNDDGEPVDPVARFHLGNGARLERINWLGDLSVRGLIQAAGLMVNYLYDLKHIESNHERFAKEREVAASSAVRRLLTAQRDQSAPSASG